MPIKIRIATFNLENLDDKPGQKPTLAERIALIQPQLLRINADILCLQEQLPGAGMPRTSFRKNSDSLINYQAGEVRSTKNLSGGESVIVSLALALGLSQMASRNVRVDSLFLDEGFGTLDGSFG